jgi:hypothetical protein
MSILLALVIGLHPLAWTAPDPACRRLVPMARTAMTEALRIEGAAFPVPWVDDDRVWVAGRDERDAARCVASWGGNPAGGGYHGAVLIELEGGRVLDVAVGRHLR